MDFNVFVNEWIPEHCPIIPFTSCIAVHLYLDKHDRLHNLAWVDETSKGWNRASTYRFIIHEGDLPDVKGMHSVNTGKPFIEVHKRSK